MLFFLRGGALPPAPPAGGGYQSLLAFWMGGAGAEPGTPTPTPTRDRSPDAYYKPERPEAYVRAKKRYYAQLQEELDRQLEEREQAAIRAAEAEAEQVKPRTKRKKAQKPTEISYAIPLMGEAPPMQRKVAEMLASQPRTDTSQRLYYEALLAELDRIAQHMAMQDEEDAIFMLFMR